MGYTDIYDVIYGQHRSEFDLSYTDLCLHPLGLLFHFRTDFQTLFQLNYSYL
jgi:hypothetical protein